jgi:hypothetical protein
MGELHGIAQVTRDVREAFPVSGDASFWFSGGRQEGVQREPGFAIVVVSGRVVSQPPAGGLFLKEEAEIRRYTLMFEHLRAAASGLDATAAPTATA